MADDQCKADNRWDEFLPTTDEWRAHATHRVSVYFTRRCREGWQAAPALPCSVRINLCIAAIELKVMKPKDRRASQILRRLEGEGDASG
jgi:hypothetical protein